MKAAQPATPRTAADVATLAEDILIIGAKMQRQEDRDAIEMAAYTLWDYAEILENQENETLEGV